MVAESETDIDEAYKMLRKEAVCVSRMVLSTTSPHIRIQNNKRNTIHMGRFCWQNITKEQSY
jgi:hypothetical protein